MTDAAAEVAADVGTVYNRTLTRLELSDGSMLGAGGMREDFAITDYERSLAESGSLTIVRPDDEPLPVPETPEASEPEDDDTAGGDGE